MKKLNHGIYKDLRIEFWHKEKNGRNNSTGFSIYYHYKWKKKCKNVSADVTHVPVDSPPATYEFGGWHYTIPLYHGTTALTKYYVATSCRLRSSCTLLNYNHPIAEMNHGY